MGNITDIQLGDSVNHADVPAWRRVTVSIPKDLVDFADDECKRLSNQYLKWNRSNLVTYLLLQYREGKILGPNTKRNSEVVPSSENEYFDSLLKLGGYRK